MEQVVNKSLLSLMCEEKDNSIAVYNPVNDKIIGYVPSLSSAEIYQRIEKSKVAQVVKSR